MNGSEKVAQKANKMSREDFIKNFGIKTASVAANTKKDNKDGKDGKHTKVSPFVVEKIKQEPRFPNDPEQYTEAYLKENPILRFWLNSEDFPFFSRQAKTVGFNRDGKKIEETLPLDYTASRFVRATADMIAVLAGETNEESGIDFPAADMAVYLDKSARPVGWLVNVFWDAFADKPKPPKSAHLAIDRGRWLRAFDIDADSDGKIRTSDGRYILATPEMIREKCKEKDIDISLKSAVRALFIPGGVETDDPETIMNTPTGLEGKNITIVDEVLRSGCTLEIAKILLSKAIPEAASINTRSFWSATWIVDNDRGIEDIDSVPVWYDSKTNIGRGIDDVNVKYWYDLYEKYPNPTTRARKIGAALLGTPFNLFTEPGDASRELLREIKRLRKEWDSNHIMMPPGYCYNYDKCVARLAEQGVSNVDLDYVDSVPSNDQRIIIEKLMNRQPVPPHYLIREKPAN